MRLIIWIVILLVLVQTRWFYDIDFRTDKGAISSMFGNTETILSDYEFIKTFVNMLEKNYSDWEILKLELKIQSRKTSESNTK